MDIYILNSDNSDKTLITLVLAKIRFNTINIIEVTIDELISYIDNPDCICIFENGRETGNFKNFSGTHRVLTFINTYEIEGLTTPKIFNFNSKDYPILLNIRNTEDKINLLKTSIKSW